MQVWTFEELITLAMDSAKCSYDQAEQTILQWLKQYHLKPQDIVTWLNYHRLGISQRKLGKLLKVSEDTIFRRIKKVQNSHPDLRKVMKLLVPSLKNMWSYNPSRDDKQKRTPEEEQLIEELDEELDEWFSGNENIKF